MFKIVRQRQFSIIRLASASSRHAHAASSVVAGHHQIDLSQVHNRVGKREIVGFGINGRPQYFDHPPYPMPPVRWQADSPELAQLREKARGDWGNLSLEEKKALYRADFCQTISEVCHKGQGEWKWVTGSILCFLGVCLWGYALFTKTIYNYPKTSTHTVEHQTRMLERMIAQGQGRVHGLASEWDYEKGKWK